MSRSRRENKCEQTFGFPRLSSKKNEKTRIFFAISLIFIVFLAKLFKFLSIFVNIYIFGSFSIISSEISVLVRLVSANSTDSRCQTTLEKTCASPRRTPQRRRKRRPFKVRVWSSFLWFLEKFSTNFDGFY